MTTDTQRIAQSRNGGEELAIAEQYSGPLPSPSMLREYNDVIPGMGEDIVNEFKHQGKHRRTTEKLIVFGQLYFGPCIAAIIVLCAFFISYRLVMAGKSLEGFGTFFTTLAILGGLFVWNTIQSSKKSD